MIAAVTMTFGVMIAVFLSRAEAGIYWGHIAIPGVLLAHDRVAADEQRDIRSCAPGASAQSTGARLPPDKVDHWPGLCLSAWTADGMVSGAEIGSDSREEPALVVHLSIYRAARLAHPVRTRRFGVPALPYARTSGRPEISKQNQGDNDRRFSLLALFGFSFGRAVRLAGVLAPIAAEAYSPRFISAHFFTSDTSSPAWKGFDR